MLMGLLIFILGMVVGQFLNRVTLSLSPGTVRVNVSPSPKPVWRRLPVVDAFIYRLSPVDRWRVLAVELLSGVGFLLAWFKFGKQGNPTPEWGVFVFYLCLMLVIAVIDLRDRLILNKLVYPFIPVAIVLATFSPMGAGTPPNVPVTLLNSLLFSLLGGAVAFIILLLPAIIKPGGMGFGDVKLAGLVGLATGFPGSLIAMLLAISGGGLVATLLLILGRKSRRDAIPFGPFICAGMLAALVWGAPIANWYLGLIR